MNRFKTNLAMAYAACFIFIFSIMAHAAASRNSPEEGKGVLVTAEWLGRNLTQSNLVILHVSKDRSTYKTGHIRGALFVGKDEFIEAAVDGVVYELPTDEKLIALIQRLGIDESKRIIIYSDDAGILAARMFFTLDYLGLGEQAAVLDGQWQGWKSNRWPVSVDVPTPEPSSFVPTFKRTVRVKLKQMQDLLKLRGLRPDDKTFLIIDARSDEEFSGKKPGEGIRKAGHIPSAENVCWLKNIASESNPVLKSRNELKQLYRDVGLVPNQKVVVYCRAGGQSALDYFVLKYLDYDARLYDGGYLEWSNAPDTTVDTYAKPGNKKKEKVLVQVKSKKA